MFFATTQSPVRRQVYAHAGRSLERFMDNARASAVGQGCAYDQDETSFHLTLDVPGISKEHLSISIDGAVVRVQSKDGAPRQYRTAYELPQELDAALSSAKLENGVLSLKLVKKVPVNTASELPIQ